MRLAAASTLLSSLLLLAPTLVRAVFQDEAYQIDFQHALLGEPVPRSTFFFQPTLGSRATLVYTISEKGLVGAINPRDGALVWRQRQVPRGTCTQSFTGHLDGANGTNTVVSAYGDSVAAWEAATGRMLWSFSEIGCIRSLVVPDITGQSQDPVILMDEQGTAKLISINTITGKLIWEVRDDVGDLPYALASGGSYVFYVALRPSKLSKGYKIHVTSVHPTTARPLGQNTLSTEGEIKSEDDILYVSPRTTDPIIAWTDKSLKSLKINVLGTDDITTIKVRDSKQPVQKISVHGCGDPSTPGYYLVHYATATSHWAEIYLLDKAKKTIKKTHELEEREGEGVFAASSIKSHVFFSRITQDEITLHFASTGDLLEKWPVSVQLKEAHAHGNGYSYLAAEVVTRGTANYALRGAVLLNSGDLVLTRNGEVDWTRMESIAGITAAAWVETDGVEELARELAIESHNNPLRAYIHRLQRHIKDLQSLPDWIQSIPPRIVRSLTGAPIGADADETGEAEFGFKKVVIVTTEKGQVAALDTGARGKIVWSTKAVDLPAGQKWNATHIEVTSDRAIVFADRGSSVTLELSSGAIVEQKHSDANSAARTFPISTTDGRSVMLQLSDDGTPQANPSLGPIEDATVIVTQANNGALSGWMMNSKKAAYKVWSFAIPEGEVVAATAHRPSHDPVASIGRALGDRNVLYKFINPNTVIIITAHITDATITVHLLDTVNGQTLHRTKHAGVDPTKPITATMSENWLAYTYFTEPSLVPSDYPADTPKGYVLTISELFESPLPNDPGPLEDATNFSSVTGRLYVPTVISQSYVIPLPVTYLTTTSTKQGITPRSLLVYSPTICGILAIPVPMLSPRKPIGRDPTAAEREEGLAKYKPLLEIHSAWTISHQRELLGINGIVTTPTQMESTSLVFAYGELDIFGTRVAPIGSFDILGKGFGKVQLLLTIVALAIGTRLLAPMVLKKQVNALWSS